MVYHNSYVKLLLKGKLTWVLMISGTRIVTAQDLARAQLGAGDSVMNRLYEYVKSDGGKIDEQIDKFTGAQASAEHLTWSYANILHALHIRKGLVKSFEKLA